MKNLLCLLPLLTLSAFAAAPPPANDDFANRTALVSSGSISIADRNASATTEALEPTIAGDVVSRSVWYSWTAPFTGPVTVSTAGSSFDTLLGVFTGMALGALSSIAENDDSGTGAFTSIVNFNAQSGIPYVILIGGYNGAGGKIRLGITVGSGPCSYSVSPTSKSFSNTSGSGTVSVTTSTGCSWSAASNDSFISITSGSTGSGSGTVSYSITANTALTARIGTMTIAGATVTIDQAAAPACTYTLTPSTTNAPSTAVTNTVAMTAGTGCAWTATPNGSWITIASGASGTGSALITYVLAANTNSNQRVGTITAAGQTFTITQAGVVPCTYSISPPSGSFNSSGGSSNIVITTLTGCAWTASSPVTWVTFSTTNGTGNATVTYTVAANTNTVSRSTTLTVAGQSYAVSQTGTACTYSLLPSSLNVSATNGTSSVSVAAGQGCAWTAVANVSWITITAGTSGTGSGSVVFTWQANLNTVTRSGTITIAGLTFTLNQAAAACIYSITPTAAHYVATGGPGNIAVTAGTGCAWTAVSNNGFITVDSGSPGTGSGTVGYTVTANATTVSRTGTITVAGSTFTITQDGTTPCTYSIAPTSASFTSIGGTNSIAVTANAGCTWSVSSAATFLSFTPASGSGNGTVSYTVAANTTSLTRSGTMNVAGQTFTVTQTGVACIYTIAPTSASYTSTGGSGTVAVTATQGCNWTSTSDSTWLVVTSGASGTGNGSVGYTVAAATSSVTRTGRLTIAGKLLIVTQTGIPCTYSISPNSVAIDNPGGSGSIAITASDGACSWTATSGVSWVTVSPASGTGSGSVTYTVAPTALAVSRVGTLLVAGNTFTVTQDGDTTAPTVTLTVPANGSTISNIVTLTATATDDSSVSRVEFYRGAGVLLGTDLTSPYTLPFQTTNLANGAYTFYARGFDPANNQGSSATNSSTISNSASSNTNTWAQRFGGTGTDVGHAVAVDSSGNIYLAATFSGTVVVGPNTFVSNGGRDIILAKFNSAGTHQWSFSFGSTGDEFPISIVLDASANIYLGGYFSGNGNFGGSTLTSAGGLDFWLGRYNSSGVHQWSERFGGTADEAITSITLDLNQTNVLATGHYQGTVNFGPVTLSSADSGTDTFLSKYVTSSGAPVWAKSFANRGYDTGISIRTDASDNVILGGYFSTRIDLGNGLLFAAGTNGQADIYIAKYPPSSTAPTTATWQQRYGAGNSELMDSAAIDSSGDIVCAGTFQTSTDLGGGTITGTSVGNDMFVAKYSGATGLFVWQKGLLCTQGGEATSLAFDSTKQPVILGSFFGAVNFGGSSVSSVGSQDIFAAKLTTAGVLVWARSFGGSSGDSGSSIALGSDNYPVATGSFGGSASFAGTVLVSGGLNDIFLMRISP